MNSVGRFYVVTAVLLIAGLGVGWRMVDLSIRKHDFLAKQGDARMRRVVDIPAHRGMITDRTGKPLAVSAQVHAVWVNPQLIPDDAPLDKLSKLVGWDEKKLRQRLEDAESHSFIYLNRSIPPEQADEIKKLDIPGVYTERTYKRFYPEAEVMAHILGYTNVDDRGQEGLELAFDDWLKGVPGKKEVIKDRLGRVVADLNNIRAPREGHNLVLSVDSRIQFMAYRALASAVEEYKAKWASLVMVDVTTGEILAMVNIPSYNPNLIAGPRDGRFRNRAVTDVYEPGSTLKAFSVLTFLKSGKFKPDTIINTNPGYIVIDGHRISDVHPCGVVTLSEAVKKSSNVAMSKMALQVNAQDMWKTLLKMGFGERSDTGFPGEIGGLVGAHVKWRPIEAATLAMGYGVAVTPLQIAQGYSIIGAGGIKRQLSMVKVDKPPPGDRVVSAKDVDALMQMLLGVTSGEGGTGKQAVIPGYNVAGKTGTAYIASGHGYDHSRYNSSFVGIVPVDHPRLACVVVISEPHGAHFGGAVAAPVFAKVMAGALRLLAVTPDNLPKQVG